jgi:hypothetical protein
MTIFYIFRSKPRFLKKALLGGAYKTVFWSFLPRLHSKIFRKKHISYQSNQGYRLVCEL